MLIEMNLDEKLVDKIKELLQSDTYETEKDVIVRAIENLYERTMASDGRVPYSLPEHAILMKHAPNESVQEGKGMGDILVRNTAGDAIAVEFKSRLDTGFLRSIFEEAEPAIDSPDKPDRHTCVVPQDRIPKSGQIYGVEYAGLIWGFHNRFFPVKFIITQLAKIMVEKKTAWLDFEEFKAEIGSRVMPLVGMLSQMDFHSVTPTVGFPKTFEAFKEMPRLKKMGRNRRDEKARELTVTSKHRFIDQYVGRELVSRPGENRKVAGACFEMNLMTAGSWDEDSELQVTLTELGQKFLELPDRPKEKLFSELESNFIVGKIIPQFELENLIVGEFLALSKKTTVEEITKIFLDKQKQYLQEKKLLVKVKTQESLQKYASARATTVMTRLVELGKVKRIKDGLRVSYTVI